MERPRLSCKSAIFVLSLMVPLTQASEAPIINPKTRFHPVYGTLGMVVTQEAIASQVGADILAEGGNAIDAAVASGFALAVTLPRAGNLAGGGFMVIHLAKEDRTIALDYREMAPAESHREMFIDEAGDVDKRAARYSIKSSGVPGTVAGLLHAHKSYGVLNLEKVLSPAIKLAREGFEVSLDLSSSLSSRHERLSSNLASRKYFFKPNGESYQPGELFIQKDLAQTLERISEYGRAGFYEGKTARLIVDEMKNLGGLITLDDLRDYRVVTREPVCGDFHGNTVCAMPPPSSGGVHLIQMLNILEGWDLRSLGHNSAAYIHRLAEAMRRAYADRSIYLGDPDFYRVPIDNITDKNYASALRSGINLVKATPSVDVQSGLDIDPDTLQIEKTFSDNESSETTHFSTWDQWGNVVSNTTTLNFSYGNGISIPGAGFLMNNEMDDFSAKPGTPNAFGLLGGVANAIEPGKRPLSSMTPSIVFDKASSPLLVTGSPGGSTIITTVLQTILNVLVFDMGIAEGASVPRVHHQWFPDRLLLESGISRDTVNLLSEMGHNIGEADYVLGDTQSIQRGPKNSLFGASDPRRPGAAAVAQ